MMFERIKRLWEGFKNMFTKSEIEKIAGTTNIELSSEMVKNIELWKAMLGGSAPWAEKAPSIGTEAGICREFADIAINEMEASVDNERLDELFQAGIENLNENLQDGLALGSFVIKPFLDGDKVDTEYVTADNFIPVSFDSSGKPTDMIFIEHKRVNDYTHYFRCERHTLTSTGLLITNTAYKSSSATVLGNRVSLANVDEWARYPEERTYPIDQMDFGYFRVPKKNRIDGSKCGVSIYADSIDLIKKVDVQAARIDWEFESGERAVHVDERALRKDKNGDMRMPHLNNRLYRGLDLDNGSGSELYKEYSPAMRQDDFLKGLEAYRRDIEFSVGLAYGDLSDVQYVDKTATEIKSAKQRKYNRVNAIQKALEACLSDYVDALAFFSRMYTKGYEFNCTFSDSILADEEAERNQDRQDVAMGVMKLEEYRAKWYNEDIEDAKKNLPEQTNIIPME